MSDHPFLTNHQEEDLHSSVLLNTNADFPVSKLVELEDMNQDSVHVNRPQRTTDVVESDEMEKQISEVEMESLSPFSQWLLTLKPISVAGSSGYSPGSGSPVSPEISDLPKKEKAEKSDKKKKKKKKKKKEAHRKAVKPDAALPVLDKDIASDTLAELIASQGHIEEAIAMYRKLVSLYPDKAAHYLQKITDLRQFKP